MLAPISKMFTGSAEGRFLKFTGSKKGIFGVYLRGATVAYCGIRLCEIYIVFKKRIGRDRCRSFRVCNSSQHIVMLWIPYFANQCVSVKSSPEIFIRRQIS